MPVVFMVVRGTPAPKGSSRAMIRGGRPINVPSGSDVARDKLKSWDSSVREAACEVLGKLEAPPFVDRPLRVELVFRMRRLASHWGTGRNAGRLRPDAPTHQSSKPDADKLARSTLDSLTGIVFDDDSRIAELVVLKIYAAPGDEGATIRVEAL